MALKFNQQQGSAKKSSANNYKYEDGENTFRIVGDIVARYVYWVKGTNGKNVPVECLSFDRDQETFTNTEKDWVEEFYPDLKCSWSYVTQCISDGELKVLNLKKKLWEQICNAAEDLGDPTDPETGWDVKFKRVKTGPQAYNVEYHLQPLRCKPRALTDEERELVAKMKPIDEVIPRQTPAKQKEFLDKINNPEDDNVDKETIEEEFEVD